jgi:CO/xanthine dehydrogenase Mo-binding subunit/aerobic-type carbon monoxide dehydrogenase small subunit (CoxS/CutS family)
MSGDPEAIADRVAGTLRYTIDLQVEGMLHAALVRSPEPSGRLRQIDTRPAATMPGVVRVVTAADLATLGLADTRFGTVVPDQPILADGHVRHAGEPCAAVVAETLRQAIAGAAAVTIEVEPSPPLLDPDAALAPGARLIHNEVPGNVLGRHAFTNGDMAAAERSTVHRFAGVYTSPAAQHVTFEPQVCLARWSRGTLEMWAATQSPSRIAAELARVFALDPSAVRLHVPPLGGGYGGKNHAKLEPLTAALAALVGRPVRLANRRWEEFVTTTKHPARIELESGVDAHGRFTFRRAAIRWSSGAYAHSSAAVVRQGALVVCGPYEVPAAQVESVMAYTNLPPAGSFRGLGANQAAWAGERQIDEIARALADDPIEFRRRNVVRPGGRLPTGERIEDAHWLDCLDRVASSIGAERRGRGVALAMKQTMTPSRSDAVVAALADGTIEVRSSLVDMGQGVRTVLARAAARELRIPEDRIRVVEPDTAITPFDAGTFSSRGAWAGTRSVTLAAAELRRRLEDPSSDERAIAALVRATGEPEVSATGSAVNEAPIDAHTGRPASSSHWHQGAVAVRVDVDAETGVVSVPQAVAAAWAGRVIDAGRARLQNEGGLIFGLGPALFEELAFPGGLPGATSLLDYRIPSILDVPARLETEALEEPGDAGEPTGLGESVIPAVAPAIAAAIVEWTGRDLRDLPMTPERVLGGPGPVWTGVQPGPAVGGADDAPVPIELTVDGRLVRLSVDPLLPLQEVLAERLGIRSVRAPCGVGVCGACTVLVGGRAIRSCLRPVGLAAGREVVTSDGLAADDEVRAAFVAAGAAQCGSCIPGAVLAARDLLARDPQPDDGAIRRGLAGNLCRCGTYGRILDAVHGAAVRSHAGGRNRDPTLTGGGSPSAPVAGGRTATRRAAERRGR